MKLICSNTFSKATSDTKQNIIYAFGSTNPGSTSQSATLIQHDDRGVLSLNLAASSASLNPVDPNPGSGSSGGGSTGPSTGVTGPYSSYEKKIIAHAVFVSFGFIVFLPTGVLVARWLRMVIPNKWFNIHQGIQAWLCKSILILKRGLYLLICLFNVQAVL